MRGTFWRPLKTVFSSRFQAGGSVESYHFSGAQHGHNLKLMPSAALLADSTTVRRERGCNRPDTCRDGRGRPHS